MRGDSTSPSFVSAIPRAEAMAEKKFSLVEVVDGLEGSDFEDLDMDEDDRDECEHEGHSRDETTENESDRESV